MLPSDTLHPQPSSDLDLCLAESEPTSVPPLNPENQMRTRDLVLALTKQVSCSHPETELCLEEVVHLNEITEQALHPGPRFMYHCAKCGATLIEHSELSSPTEVRIRLTDSAANAIIDQLAQFRKVRDSAKLVQNQINSINTSKVPLSGMVMAIGRQLSFQPKVSDSFDLVQHIYRQRAFSHKTFGPGVRTQGVLDHISKELVEIADKPHDLSEWVDVVLLALDGAWRAGFTPEEIAQAINTKQTKNEGRNWPDWRTAPPDKAIEHDRSKD